MIRCILIGVSLIAINQSSLAVESAAMSTVLATRGGIQLTIEDIDTVLQKAPESQRASIVAGSDRVQQLIDSELLSKQVAQRGRELKLDLDPVVKRRISRAIEQELAAITVDHIMASAKPQDFSLLAKEGYLANPAKFQKPETSVVQHILIGKTDRTPEAVLKLANEVLKQASNPTADFEALVMQYSDDPSKKDNKGVMEVSESGQFVPAFETAAHALKKVGAVSGLVETEYGTHILRLVERRPPQAIPFEKVKAELIASLEDEYKAKVRAKLFSDLRSANPVFNAENIKMLPKVYGADKLVITPEALTETPGAKAQ